MKAQNCMCGCHFCSLNYHIQDDNTDRKLKLLQFWVNKLYELIRKFQLFYPMDTYENHMIKKSNKVLCMRVFYFKYNLYSEYT